jgi:uncharacterized protein YecT (DUF1311 family)
VIALAPALALTLAAPQAADYATADRALNAEYRQTMTLMQERDRQRAAGLKRGTERADGLPTYAAALLAAQRAWIGFRDANCRIESFQYRGGSAQRLTANGCLARMTEARTAELRQLRQSFRPL